MYEASFDSLRKVQLQEKSYAALSSLDDDFFEKYRLLLLEHRERLRTDFSLDAASALESTSRLLNEVMRRREQKLFLKAFRDFHAGEVSSAGLAKEEKDVYVELVGLLRQYEARLLGEVAGASAASAASDSSGPKKSGQPEEIMAVQLLVDLPAFVGARGQVGPFSASQKAQLPIEDARLLIEQGAAREA